MPTLSAPHHPVRSPSVRPRLPLLAAIAAALALGAGCDPDALTELLAEGPPAELPPIDEGVDVDPEPDPIQRPAGPTVGQCEAAPRWFQGDASLYVYTNSFLEVTPNEGLVLATDTLGGTGAILRTQDGAVVAQGALPGLLDIDDRWRRRLDYAGDYLAVRDLITSEELAQVSEQDFYNTSGALSQDGGRVATVRCAEGVLSLAVRDVDNVTTLWDAPLDVTLEWCPGWSELTPLVTFGPSEDIVVVGVPSTGELHVIDVAAETETVTPVHTLPTETPLTFVQPSALLDMATDDSGALLVTTGGDGLLRRFKLPGLIEVGEPIEVGVVAVNLSVYASPRMSSPVAVSPDGEVIAAITRWVLNEDQTEELERSVPVLLDAASGDELMRLTVDVGVEPSEIQWDDADRAVGLSFSPSGGALIGRFGAGIGMWACEGFNAPTAAAPLAVLLDGPLSATVGDEVTFTATHLGSDALHAHTFYLDGEMLWGSGGLERTATFTLSEAGEHELTVVVDDGAATGSTSMQVSVTP